MMKECRPLRIVIAWLAGILPAVAQGAKAPDAVVANQRLGIGINLGNALEAPREGEWGLRLEASYFAEIADAGFQSVRVPVRWSAHAGDDAPYRIDKDFFARIDWVLEQSLDRGLAVVLNMHHYEELVADPSAHRERFVALWRQIAERYRDRPASLLFEVLNEPHGSLTHEVWNPLLAETVQAIRESNPHRTLVVGPDSWNTIAALKNFRLPPGDDNLIVTVHYYDPFHFTHQGAEWVGQNSAHWLGTRWEGREEEKAAVSGDLETAASWADENGVPLYLGEFGAYEKADLASRVAWTRWVREKARRLGMSVAYWEFGAGFGVYDRDARQWREALLGALLPPSGPGRP